MATSIPAECQVNVTQPASPTKCQKFLSSKCAKILPIVIAVLASTALICIGALNLVGAASFFLLVAGFMILGFLITGVILASIVVNLRKLETEPLPKIEEEEQIPPLLPELEETEIEEEVEIKAEVEIEEDITPPTEITEEPAQAEDVTSQLGTFQGLMSLASNYLEEHRASVEPKSWGALHPPMNEDISYFAVLVDNKKKEIEDLLRIGQTEELQFPKDPAVLEQFNALTTQLMYLAFAESYLSLQDASSYLAAHSYIKSIAEVLSRKQSFHFRTYNGVSRAYNFIRFLHDTCKPPLSQKLKEARSAKFYTEGTTEYTYRAIHEFFCREAKNNGDGGY
ncbi:hypothetical protein [Chlamydia vaughanii]|uniref:hypothetical protein n=1 Tax=Chlamydia vaughanii TaxID=3112552 RepID=UPI0032B1306B